MLRVRRHVRGQERRHVDGDALGQAAARSSTPRAEVCTAADNSCLMHIGGALRKQRTGVRAMHLAEILAADRDEGLSAPRPRESLQDSQLRRNLGKATQTIRAKRLRTIAGAARLGAAARGGRRDQGAGDGHPARAARAPGGRRHPRRRHGPLGARRRRGDRDRRPDRRGQGRARGDQGQVAGHRRDRPQRGPARARDRGDRDRPGGADHPARRRQAVAHPRAGDPLEPRGDQGAVRAHDRGGPGPRLGGDGDRRGRPPAPAREVPDRAGRRLRRELRDRRDRHDLRRRVRGQRPHVHDAARDADHRDGDREGAAGVARPRGLPRAAAALLHGRADEPVHVAVDRRARAATARRSSTSSCSTTAAPACSPTRSAARRCTASAARRA